MPNERINEFKVLGVEGGYEALRYNRKKRALVACSCNRVISDFQN